MSQRKITDYFDRIDPSSPGGTHEYPSKHSESSSINDSRAEGGSSVSKRGTQTQTSSSDAQGTKTRGVKSAYNSNRAKGAHNSRDVNLKNIFSKQPSKNSINKNNASRCQCTSNCEIPTTSNKDSANLESKHRHAEILVLSTFKKIVRTRISRSSQIYITSKNNFKSAKKNKSVPPGISDRKSLLNKIAKLSWP